MVRFQAVVRGALVRDSFNLQLGCAIIIQAASRRFLAVRHQTTTRALRSVENAKRGSLRENSACCKIQFWWRVVVECRKERKAALTIERFFLFVKAEVDREIRRAEQKQKQKTQGRRRDKKQVDVKFLERVWLNTVDENNVEVLAYSPSDSESSKQLSSPGHISTPSSSGTTAIDNDGGRELRRKTENNQKKAFHRSSPPSLDLTMRNDYEIEETAPTVSLSYSSSPISHLTGSTTPPMVKRVNSTDEDSLEETFREVASLYGNEKKVSSAEKKVSSAEKKVSSGSSAAETYRQKYGLKKTPSSIARPPHFFADDLESLASTVLEPPRTKNRYDLRCSPSYSEADSSTSYFPEAKSPNKLMKLNNLKSPNSHNGGSGSKSKSPSIGSGSKSKSPYGNSGRKSKSPHGNSRSRRSRSQSPASQHFSPSSLGKQKELRKSVGSSPSKKGKLVVMNPDYSVEESKTGSDLFMDAVSKTNTTSTSSEARIFMDAVSNTSSDEILSDLIMDEIGLI